MTPRTLRTYDTITRGKKKKLDNNLNIQKRNSSVNE